MEIIAKEMERNGIRVFSRRGVFKIIELAQSVLFVSLSHDNDGIIKPFSAVRRNTARLSLFPMFNLPFTRGQRYFLNGHT